MSESLQPSAIPDQQQQNNFPDFTSYGYQVTRELGQNRQGGRVTYLATEIKTEQFVAIKQFQFAQTSSDWSGYDAYEQEIRVLRQLDHPNIPRYLDSFETPTGFCLVQEYKKASSLAQARHFTVDEIKQIAIEVLKVLIYLQQQHPPVIHRDLKPENILVNRQRGLQVYLVDFGFARMGVETVAVSSAIKGTLGFMPPEQLFNRELTLASDLYSLGITLICLLTKTKSTEVGQLMDETYQIDFKVLTLKFHPEFVSWLEKMVTPNPKNRYSSAAMALAVLYPLKINRAKIVAKIDEKLNYRLGIGLAVIIAITWGSASLLSYLIFAINLVANVIFDSTTEYGNAATQELPLGEKITNNIRQLKATRACWGCELIGVNLQYAYLQGANLQKARLLDANLTKASLRRAILSQANLISADLNAADLQSANFQNAWLINANLNSADLQNSNGSGAVMDNAVLYDANLQNANLRNASLRLANLDNGDLQGAILQQADLRSADLVNANLQNAVLQKADLRGANLYVANLRGADFLEAKLEGANLVGADLRNANLQNAMLRGANLQAADLREANLIGADLQGATMPDGTIHP